MGPSSDRSSHQVLRLLHVEALVASSAYHTWWTSGERELSWSIRGVIARAYMAIARGSPRVVPSVDAISPLPVMKSLIGALYVFTSTWASGGQMMLMLWRAAFRLMELKALVASTNRTASVLGSSNGTRTCNLPLWSNEILHDVEWVYS